MIKSQELLGFITGEILAPDHEMDSSDGSGKILNPGADQLVKAWITGTLLKEVLGPAVGLKTTADVWRALAEAFS